MIDYEKEHSVANDYFYSQIDDNLIFHSHIHNSFEFFCVREGEMQITIHDKTYTVTAGDTALIFPNTVHSYSTGKFSKSYLCIFSPSYVNTYYQKTKDVQLQTPIMRMTDFADIIDKLTERENDFFALKAILYEIISLFNKVAVYGKRNEKLTLTIESIIRYVEEHFKDDISMKSMANALGYHYNYLSGIFNETFHTNFSAFVNDYRMNHAQYLLENRNDFSITDIAQECGYMSIRSFNRNFLKVFHISPSAYRHRYPTTILPPPVTHKHGKNFHYYKTAVHFTKCNAVLLCLVLVRSYLSNAMLTKSNRPLPLNVKYSGCTPSRISNSA